MLDMKLRKDIFRVKAGTSVKVDKIKVDTNCMSGVALRVVGTWSRPTWLDLDFFFDTSEIENTTLADLCQLDEK